MATPDGSLGINASFDADQFRSAIKFAMQMGSPPDSDKQVYFISKSSAATYFKNGFEVTGIRLDRDKMPLDPDVEVRTAADVEIQVDCAIEVVRADTNEIPVGNFGDTKAVVTLLDVDYEQVKDCQEIRFNGDIYQRGYEPDGLGLFDVGINTIIYYALQET